MPWTALVGGLIAGAASGAINYASARQSQQETIDAYKHRHQWQTADLRAAGLNPVLSATQGAGSVGNMAQAQAPDIAQSVSNVSAAQLRREEINTAKTTQAQQVAQAANLTATAREAEANADIAQQVAGAYRANPELAQTRALTEAGMSPNNPLGLAGQFIHRGDQQFRRMFSGDNQSSAAQSYYEGGAITKYLKSKPMPPRNRGWRTNAK